MRILFETSRIVNKIFKYCITFLIKNNNKMAVSKEFFLDRDFFMRDTLTVAQELLGKILHFNGIEIVINETEAYCSHKEDPACHASRGVTSRTRPLFRSGGISYVYLIYGVHYCLNFVTESEGIGAGVLIRGGMLDTEDFNAKAPDLGGPGKLCRYLGVNANHNEIDITNNNWFYLLNSPNKTDYIATPRIGISTATDKLWRFIDIKSVNHKKLKNQILRQRN